MVDSRDTAVIQPLTDDYAPDLAERTVFDDENDDELQDAVVGDEIEATSIVGKSRDRGGTGVREPEPEAGVEPDSCVEPDLSRV